MLRSASMIVIFGAFLVATVFGGIASEVQLASTDGSSSSEFNDFMCFSLDIHKIPLSLKIRILEYMRVIEEVIEAHAQLGQFFELINPHHAYLTKRSFFYIHVSKMWIFEKAQEDEIMFIASNLKTIVCMADEKVIIRGDLTNDVYFILNGTVDIRLQENSTKDLAASNKAMFKVRNVL